MYKQYTLIFVIIKFLICLSQSCEKKNHANKTASTDHLDSVYAEAAVLGSYVHLRMKWYWFLSVRAHPMPIRAGKFELGDVINPVIHLKDLIHNFLCSLVIYFISKDDTLPDIYHRIQDMLGKQVFSQTFKNLYFYSKNLLSTLEIQKEYQMTFFLFFK